VGAVDNQLKRAALASTRLLLRPVVRLLLRCGVTWKELAELCRVLYVEVAADDYGKHGRPANASRVAILTGLSRRDVKKVKDFIARGEPDGLLTIARIDHASRVLTGWHQDRDFVDRKGAPRLLPIAGDCGFEALVKRYAPDIPPTAMLKELVSVGAVRETAQGKARAVSRYFMPARLDPDGVVRSGSVLRDFAATVAHNQLRDPSEAPRFEGRATNIRVRRVSRRAFREFLEAHGMQFLEEVDRWLSEHEAKSPDEKTDRLGVGVYLIMDD
jgi:hypothetical protein